MKDYSFFFCFLIVLVTAVAVPVVPDDNANFAVTYPGLPCKADWICPSSEFCNMKKGVCQLRKGRCLKNKDCPNQQDCVDTHCFPHSRNDRRDVDESTDSDEPEVASDPQLQTVCVNNTDCSSNELCSHGNCVLKLNRCWVNQDCGRRRHCVDTVCRPYLSRRDSEEEPNDIRDDYAPAPSDSSDETEVEEDEAETANDINTTPVDERDVLGLLEKRRRRNKCTRGCKSDADCCRGDTCFYFACLGPNKE